VFLILIAAMVGAPVVAVLLGALISGSPQAPLARGMGLLAQDAVLAGLPVWRLKRLGVDLSALRLWIEDATTAWQGLVGGAGLLLFNILGSQLSMLLFYLILGAERLTELVEREQGAVRRLLDPETG